MAKAKAAEAEKTNLEKTAAEGGPDPAASQDAGDAGEAAPDASGGQDGGVTTEAEPPAEASDVSQLDPAIVEGAQAQGFDVDGQTTGEATASAQFQEQLEGKPRPAADPSPPDEPRDDAVGDAPEWDKRPGELDAAGPDAGEDPVNETADAGPAVPVGCPVMFRRNGRDLAALVTKRGPSGLIDLTVFPPGGAPFNVEGVGYRPAGAAANAENYWRELSLD